MLQKKSQRSFKTKLIAYILLLTILAFVIFLINALFLSSKPLFISPIGENNLDVEKVKRILENNNIIFSQISVLSDSTYEVTITNNGKVKISLKKDINKQVASLQRILRELTIEGKPFKNIDFRFEEPVISF